MFGHPNAGRFSKDCLDLHMSTWGYHKSSLVPCLYAHDTNKTKFTLVVDDFLIKTNSKLAIKHFQDMLEAGKFPTTYDWNASQYLGVKITYDRFAGWLDWSMPSTLPKYKLRYPSLGNGTALTPMSYIALPKGKHSQAPTPIDESPIMPIADIKMVQSVVGNTLYLARLVYYKLLTAVGSLASKRASNQSSIMAEADQLLSYIHTHHPANLRFWASDMCLRS